ncbi:hypothetical protein GY45DRAFT_123976 [Cubamyces sp. BRFM 1775]|nr:hypothetical protein GY45DRAFT_123976 [Cubamyces sp. BRFM 1775]
MYTIAIDDGTRKALSMATIYLDTHVCARTRRVCPPSRHLVLKQTSRHKGYPQLDQAPAPALGLGVSCMEARPGAPGVSSTPIVVQSPRERPACVPPGARPSNSQRFGFAGRRWGTYHIISESVFGLQRAGGGSSPQTAKGGAMISISLLLLSHALGRVAGPLRWTRASSFGLSCAQELCRMGGRTNERTRPTMSSRAKGTVNPPRTPETTDHYRPALQPQLDLATRKCANTNECPHPSGDYWAPGRNGRVALLHAHRAHAVHCASRLGAAPPWCRDTVVHLNIEHAGTRCTSQPPRIIMVQRSRVRRSRTLPRFVARNSRGRRTFALPMPRARSRSRVYGSAGARVERARARRIRSSSGAFFAT